MRFIKLWTDLMNFAVYEGLLQRYVSLVVTRSFVWFRGEKKARRRAEVSCHCEAEVHQDAYG